MRIQEPYSCYDGRYEGYMEAFSYFYYPPNILDDIGLDELKDKVWIKPGVLGSKETKQMYEKKMFNCKINIPEKKAKDDGIVTILIIQQLSLYLHLPTVIRAVHQLFLYSYLYL